MITNIVANLTGTEFSPQEGQTLKQQICLYYDSIGGICHSAFGDVILDSKSVRSDLGHPNYRNKTFAFAAIKEVLTKGIITTPMAKYKIHNKKQETGIMSANISIKGEVFRMDVVVIKNVEGVLKNKQIL